MRERCLFICFIQLRKMMSLIVVLLTFIRCSYSQVLFEELKAPLLHPRTFYLTPHQEFQLITKVLCEDIPCPEFSVKQDFPYFIQQRSYRSAKFLKLTSSRMCSLKSILDDGRERLKEYLNGGNNREEKYPPTVPLLIQVEQITKSKSPNPWCHMSYSINSYVPHYWGEIAEPQKFVTDFLDIDENMQVYVHTFNGDVEKELLREIELFRRGLDTLSLCYKKMMFYVAIYEVSHHPTDSRLELWFPKCTSRR